mmetsp:Transcript_53289/g.79161  ORF Transcript_53289/g.79161 Transcript_53289/m.79161 type:complete len:666 (-) Transcript_53289:334-2331(-)|eukprot:CAMPEP_0195518456 /NCGR_PEP_ID=MMETSP0794_2-20130614/12926_1 /TAXON_ID=515487 /ORGANISM="Stephanopyxis turris, Strain CCMP 815" /LENGTH=665 /DNA_ID=CAMNT_0040647421 /DNA_START=88 /DNA_END=2085 /DNA_ORIENTATION=-
MTTHAPKGTLDNYKVEHAASIADQATYWGEIAKESLDWFAPFTSTVAGSLENGDVAYFLNGKLNTCYNAVDRHVEAGKGDSVALIWEGDEASNVKQITFSELLAGVSRIANALRTSGVKRGDVVTIYMPMIPETVMTMLACARIGAVHSVIFAGFSTSAITDRVFYGNSRFVVTANAGKRGGKDINLKKVVDEALEHSKLKDPAYAGIDKVFVFKHYASDVDPSSYLKPGRDVEMDKLVADQRPYCPCEWMDSEDNLFILYTSGSTGAPKGLVHTTGGYSLYAMNTTKRVFDIKPSDRFACVADVGWITGHTYIVYGPLLNGCASFVFESTPTYPDAGRYWDMVQRHELSIFYTAPTAIRTLMQYGNDYVNSYDKSSLRILGSVGEPINPEVWKWYYEVVGGSKCSIVDTYWQSETGGHVITNLPSVTPMKPGSCTMPFFGVDAVVLDAKTGEEIGRAIDTGDEIDGLLAFKQPWPGMARTCLGDHGRYLSTYMQAYKGYYITGDGCRKDADGYIWITGRIDDVINVSGHRIGTAEVESALVEHPAVAQAAVVGFPHDIKGQGICAYTTLTVEYLETLTADNADAAHEKIVSELNNLVGDTIGKFARPDIILPSPSLPMTRSGKIMRRILRKIAALEFSTLGDTSTLADPSVVDTLSDRMKQMRM